MQSLRVSLIIPALLLGASACGAPYDPPVQGDHTAEQYKADLEKCRTTSADRGLARPGTTVSWLPTPHSIPRGYRCAMLPTDGSVACALRASGKPNRSGAIAGQMVPRAGLIAGGSHACFRRFAGQRP